MYNTFLVTWHTHLKLHLKQTCIVWRFKYSFLQKMCIACKNPRTYLWPYFTLFTFWAFFLYLWLNISLLDFVNLIILTRFKYNVTVLVLEDKINKYHTNCHVYFLSIHKSIATLQESWYCYKIMCKTLAGKKNNNIQQQYFGWFWN
jgi:hypothetical protein